MIYCPFYKFWIKCTKILFKILASLFMKVNMLCSVNIQIAHLVFSSCPKNSLCHFWGAGLLTTVLAFACVKMFSVCFCF